MPDSLAPRERRRQIAASLPPVDLLQRYEIEEASAYLRQSPAKTWADISAGKIKVIREGTGTRKTGRVYVPGSEIARLCRAPGAQEVA